jgi:acetyltransferase-like isoleucine patch superfamily enzyme
MKKTEIFPLMVEIIKRGIQIIVHTALFEIPPLLQLKMLILKSFFKIGKHSLVLRGFLFYKPHPTKEGYLIIGNNVSINHDVEIDYSGGVRIDDDVWISQNVIIETHEHVISELPKKEWEIRRYPLVIEKDCWIGANVIILPKVKKIGEGSIIGAGSVVTKEVPSMSIVAGIPARVIGNRKNIKQNGKKDESP